MIFLTVGTQLPFDRLVVAIDEWASTNPSIKVIAQVGDSTYKPKNIETRPALSPTEFAEISKSSRVIVSHAGMGSIITAIELCKPILIFPRSFELGEHRNDHQMSTARLFRNKKGVAVAETIDELKKDLTRILELQKLQTSSSVGGKGGPESLKMMENSSLIARLSDWLHQQE